MASTASSRNNPNPLLADLGLRGSENGDRLPRSLAKVLRADGPHDRWVAWATHLSRRNKPVALRQLLPRRKSDPLRWAVAPGGLSDETVEVLDSLDEAADLAEAAELLSTWLDDTADRPADDDFALQCLAWAHALPRLAAHLSAAPWAELTRRLIDVTRAAGAIDLGEQPAAHQMLAGELPLTLAHLLPELSPCHDLAAPACKAVARGLLELTDGEGIVHVRHLPYLPALLACWTRCMLWDGSDKSRRIGKDAVQQYLWVPRQALRLTRRDRTLAFADDDAPWSRDLLDAALRLADDPQDYTVADEVLPGRKLAKKQRRDEFEPEAATESEWSEIAVLRPYWSTRLPHLTVAYDNRLCRTELSSDGRVLWSGPWSLDVAVDGRPAAPTSSFTQVCWQSDDDVDYLELEIDLGDDCRVQRQLLLARQDRFLLMADVVLCDRPAELSYRSALPIASGITYRGDDQTREIFLRADRKVAAVLPLALPEWHADGRFGSLTPQPDALRLEQTATARALYCPLFIDLKPGRFRKQLTWRQLTVGERLEPTPRDVAVAYRAQCGHEQWLLYRSLGPLGNRTMLGQNFSSEFVVAPFDEYGESEPMLEIE